MRRVKKRVLSFLILVVIIVQSTVSYASGSVSSGRGMELSSKSTWMSQGEAVFPITADDEKWKEFQSHEEMVQACIFPDELLVELSTDELIKLILEYPLLGDLLLHSDPTIGFEIMKKECNLLVELLMREDRAAKLLETYTKFVVSEKSAVPEHIINAVVNEYGEVQLTKIDETVKSYIEQDRINIVQNIFLETILASTDIVDLLTLEEKSTLLKEVEKKTLLKQKSDIYNAYTYLFYESVEEQKIKDLMTERMSSTRDLSRTVKTPMNTPVPVIQRTYNASETLSAYEYTVTNYPNAIIVATATTNYNCHSYAWYSQSTANIYWMNNPEAYVTDGSYTRVGNSPSATGQKATYELYALVNPYVHSGIVYSITGGTIVLTSKWGAGPLVRHSTTYSPYLGSLNYYRR